MYFVAPSDDELLPQNSLISSVLHSESTSTDQESGAPTGAQSVKKRNDTTKSQNEIYKYEELCGGTSEADDARHYCFGLTCGPG